MATRWNSCLQLLVSLVLLSIATCLPTQDIETRANRLKREVEDDDVDPTFFQNGEFGPLDSKWDEAKGDIHPVIDNLQELESRQSAAEDSASSQVRTRGDKLKQLYTRLLMTTKGKRGLYGNVLGSYKIGKREFMPYELMNEYQKRLFGSVLNNFKYGKRVPEELPANYVTGGQIYDNISDDPRQQKRMYGSILNGYKMGKRNPSVLELIANDKISAYVIDCLRRPDCPLLVQNQ